MAAAFDTLTAARRMEDAGMKREQAEAVAEAVRTAAESGREELATKTDIALLKADTAALKTDLSDVKADTAAHKTDLSDVKADMAALKADLSDVRAELKADMAELKVELKGDISALRVELVDRMQSGERRMYAAVFGVGGLLFAALKLVP